MLRGRFGDTTGRPYIEGRLIIPRLNIKSDMSFLVDTGADRSLLMPGDGRRLAIDYAELGEATSGSIGIGGRTTNFEEQALLIFSERHAVYTYQIELAISRFNNRILRLPSLLGRDIIDRWRMVYSPSQDRLNFTVLSADITLPVA